MIRVGYLNDLDPYFKENMEGAISHGIRVVCSCIPWHWMKRPRARKHSMCWNRSGDIRFPIPVAYDVESKYLLDNGKTPQELANQSNIFCKAIADAGYRPILYGNNQWLTNYVDVSQVPYGYLVCTLWHER